LVTSITQRFHGNSFTVQRFSLPTRPKREQIYSGTRPDQECVRSPCSRIKPHTTGSHHLPLGTQQDTGCQHETQLRHSFTTIPRHDFDDQSTGVRGSPTQIEPDATRNRCGSRQFSPLAPETVSLPPRIVPTPLPLPPVVPAGELAHYDSNYRPKKYTVKNTLSNSKASQVKAHLSTRSLKSTKSIRGITDGTTTTVSFISRIVSQVPQRLSLGLVGKSYSHSTDSPPTEPARHRKPA